MTNGTNITTTDYIDGFQYEGEDLKFFPHAEGYVNNGDNGFEYVYNYTDHLGNVRLSYKDNNGSVEVVEENNYYPFGLKHNYNLTPSGNQDNAYKYKYNGKELQDELGLNWYDYHARNYDPALGRWMNMDPIALLREWVSPYNFVQNNPITRIDPTGALDAPIFDRETGDLLGTDSEGWEGEAIVMDKNDFKKGMDHDNALDKGTELSKHGEGIRISDADWQTVEDNGGTRMTPFVTN